MKIPMYWGGIILDSNLDAAYKYERWLKTLLENRYEKLSKNWSMLMAMNAVYKRKKKAGAYKNVFLFPLPEDPLVYIEEMAAYYEFLRLPRKKINILKLECYKNARRTGELYIPFTDSWF